MCLLSEGVSGEHFLLCVFKLGICFDLMFKTMGLLNGWTVDLYYKFSLCFIYLSVNIARKAAFSLLLLPPSIPGAGR